MTAEAEECEVCHWEAGHTGQEERWSHSGAGLEKSLRACLLCSGLTGGMPPYPDRGTPPT